MAAPSPWFDVVCQRALEVEVRCARARRVLSNAAAYLAPPILVADARAMGSRIRVVLVILGSASDDLNRASNATKAARIIALRGATGRPVAPLRSIADIVPQGDGGDDALLALRLLQSARTSTVAACLYARRCSGHLYAALDLLDFAPGLHGVDGFLQAECSIAASYIEAALDSSTVSAALAVVANWLVR